MPATEAYTNLITVAEVNSAARKNSLAMDDLALEETDLWDECVEIIQDITNSIEETVKRRLIVRPTTLRFCDWEWRNDTRFYTPVEDVLFSAYSRQWPFLQIETVDGVATATILDDFQIFRDGQIISYDTNADVLYIPTVITGFAGYRRSDQTVESAVGSGEDLPCGGSGETPCQELTDEPGLSALTVLPPLLPGRLRRDCIRLVLSELVAEIQGLIGVSQTTTTADQMRFTSRRFQFNQKQIDEIYLRLDGQFGYQNTAG